MQNIHNTAAGSRLRRFFGNRYRLTAAIGIALLLLVAAARQFETQPMSTYTSTDGGFQFRYPSTWALHVNEVSVAGTSVYHPVQNIVELDAPGKPRPYILIEYMYNVDGQNISEFIDNSSECDEITQHPGQSVAIDGMQARIYRDINCNSNGETRIYVVNGLTGYNIILHGKPVNEGLLAMVLTSFTRLHTNR